MSNSRKSTKLLLLLLAGALLSAGSLNAYAWSGTTRVHTDKGDVRGVVKRDGFGNAVGIWRGIPFATAERFGKPQAMPAWSGVRRTARTQKCFQPASRYMTLNDPGVSTPGQLFGSEECLNLNVYRPLNSSAQLPIYLFFHGGAGVYGEPVDGGMVTAGDQQIIYITANYRLGPLGHFSQAANVGDLSAEQLSGNYQILDAIQALKWVQANAAAFGGDPSRVTIGGQSNGGNIVATLLTSPDLSGPFNTSGLFQRAVVQSLPWGGAIPNSKTAARDSARKLIYQLLVDDNGWGNQNDMPVPPIATQAEAEAFLDAILPTQANGLQNNGVDGKWALDYSKKVPVARIHCALIQDFDALGIARKCGHIKAADHEERFAPGLLAFAQHIRDGVVVNAALNLQSSIVTPAYKKIPLMIGATDLESKFFGISATATPLTNLQHKTAYKLFNPNFPHWAVRYDPALPARPLDTHPEYFLPANALNGASTGPWFTGCTGWEACQRAWSDYGWTLDAVDNPANKIIGLTGMADQVWVYRFSWNNSPEPFKTVYGPTHMADLAFWTGDFDKKADFMRIQWASSTDYERTELSKAMRTYLGNFVKNGDPNIGLPVTTRWDTWTNTGNKRIVFDAANGYPAIIMAP